MHSSGLSSGPLHALMTFLSLCIIPASGWRVCLGLRSCPHDAIYSVAHASTHAMDEESIAGAQLEPEFRVAACFEEVSCLCSRIFQPFK